MTDQNTSLKTPLELAEKWYHILPFPPEFDEKFEKLTKQYPVLQKTDPSCYQFSTSDEDAGLNLLMCLYFCEALNRKYEEKGIPSKILYDTLLDIVLWTEIHHKVTGTLGFSEVGWIPRHFAFTIFRLGRLQFEMRGSALDIPAIDVKKGDPVLDVHIPRGPALDEAECSKSFAAAKSFFATYFPEYDYACFTCFSWLLDDTLADFMKEDSNTRRFRHRFTVVERFESIDILRFTVNWRLKPETISSYQPTNPFTERVMKYVADGGKFYITFGYVPKE